MINLSSIELTSDEINLFKFGLHYSFVDKNKNIKKHLAANFESLADKITENVDNHKREDFHEFFRAYVDIFTKYVYATTDYTYKHLKRIIKDPNLAVISGNKESCVVIMNKSDYQNKMQQMINDGIRDGIYKVTVDDLKTFKISYTAIFMGSTNIMKRCCQNQTNLDNFMALLRLINLTVLRI